MLWRPGEGSPFKGPSAPVGAGRRSARMSDARPGTAGTPSRVLFVTGKLAEPALRRVLGEMAPPFAYDVTVMKITVAAL